MRCPTPPLSPTPLCPALSPPPRHIVTRRPHTLPRGSFVGLTFAAETSENSARRTYNTRGASVRVRAHSVMPVLVQPPLLALAHRLNWGARIASEFVPS